MKIIVKRNKLLWHYVLQASNGQVVSTSETYFSRGNANRAARKLAAYLNAAPLKTVMVEQR